MPGMAMTRYLEITYQLLKKYNQGYSVNPSHQKRIVRCIDANEVSS